jgi:hypothetical protein
MSTDYGTDCLALDDLLDPGKLVSGEINVAYAIARRWLTPAGTMATIGDLAPYDCFDVRDYLGARYSLTDSRTIDEIKTIAAQTASSDERVQSITVAASINQGRLSLTAQVIGTEGPFSLVLAVASGAPPFLSVNGALAVQG